MYQYFVLKLTCPCLHLEPILTASLRQAMPVLVTLGAAGTPFAPSEVRTKIKGNIY